MAVPAQREAGVIKGMGRRGRTLKELAEEFGAQAEYRALYKQAQLGLEYQSLLGDEVVRLCLSLGLGIEEPVLRSIVTKVGAEELKKMKSALQERMEEMYPVKCQLPGAGSAIADVESGYMI